jgi:murein DD-endopeptidase MepM/ murein hydrolase activator NlpD
MKRRGRRGPRFSLAALLAAFCAGALVDWALRTYGPPQPVDAPTMIGPAPGGVRLKPDAPQRDTARAFDPTQSADTASDIPTSNRPKPEAAPTAGTSTLRLPIDGMNVDLVAGGFYESRGSRRHEAVDILAPRYTPVHAVDGGTIARLFLSRAGGITIYQFDPTGRFCYYYAHLQRYADNLKEGALVTQGQVIGYVGTTGNAPPNTPHLHFAVFELGDDRSWWKGRAIDPYPLLKEKARG